MISVLVQLDAQLERASPYIGLVHASSFFLLTCKLQGIICLFVSFLVLIEWICQRFILSMNCLKDKPPSLNFFFYFKLSHDEHI